MVTLILIGTYMVLLGGYSVWCLGLIRNTGLPKMRNMPPPPPPKNEYKEMNAINEYWKNTQK